MPGVPADYVPAYRLHKQSGQDVVTRSGRTFYGGKFDTPATQFATPTSAWSAARLQANVDQLLVESWRRQTTAFDQFVDLLADNLAGTN